MPGLTFIPVTQCQAIHSRSLFPNQDTPDVKSTYDFNIKSPLPVIASGILTDTKDLGDGVKLYSYKQNIPIPSYLFALASGDIEQASIGPRSVVATGPQQIKAAKWELEESTETFIQTIEKIVFPYVWQTYNVLVLPPSFPYGGMENPVYTVCYFPKSLLTLRGGSGCKSLAEQQILYFALIRLLYHS